MEAKKNLYNGLDQTYKWFANNYDSKIIRL